MVLSAVVEKPPAPRSACGYTRPCRHAAEKMAGEREDMRQEVPRSARRVMSESKKGGHA